MNKLNYTLKGKVSLVTGAAGYLGSTISATLVNLGSDIVLVDVNKAKLNKVAINLKKISKQNIDIISCNLTSSSSIEKVVKLIQKKYGKLDVLVNSIGMVGTDKMKGWNTSFKKQSKKSWDNAININLTSVFFLIQALYKLMKKAKDSSIINISSIYGTNAPDQKIYKNTNINNPAAYSVSKAGLTYMTKWLASSLAPNIRVNTISPGGIKRNQSKVFMKQYISKTLLNRMATEEDIVGAIIFLATNMSSYVTGQNIIIDGGFTTK